jgi:hypothetical protein
MYPWLDRTAIGPELPAHGPFTGHAQQFAILQSNQNSTPWPRHQRSLTRYENDLVGANLPLELQWVV